MSKVHIKEQLKKNILDHISDIYKYDVSCINFLQEAKHQVLDVAEFIDSTLDVMKNIKEQKELKKNNSNNSIEFSTKSINE